MQKVFYPSSQSARLADPNPVDLLLSIRVQQSVPPNPSTRGLLTISIILLVLSIALVAVSVVSSTLTYSHSREIRALLADLHKLIPNSLHQPEPDNDHAYTPRPQEDVPSINAGPAQPRGPSGEGQSPDQSERERLHATTTAPIPSVIVSPPQNGATQAHPPIQAHAYPDQGSASAPDEPSIIDDALFNMVLADMREMQYQPTDYHPVSPAIKRGLHPSPKCPDLRGRFAAKARVARERERYEKISRRVLDRTGRRRSA